MFPLLTTFGITLPSFNDIASSAGPYAVGFFNEMSPVAWFIVGFAIAAIILSAIIHWIMEATHLLKRSKFDDNE